MLSHKFGEPAESDDIAVAIRNLPWTWSSSMNNTIQIQEQSKPPTKGFYITSETLVVELLLDACLVHRVD